MIFFSAHGVPLAYVEEAGDPYKAEMEECVDLIMEELEKRKITNGYTLAYQVLLCFLMSFLVFYSHDPSLCFLNISDEDELCPILCLHPKHQIEMYELKHQIEFLFQYKKI
jgi:hypothetical protein